MEGSISSFDLFKLPLIFTEKWTERDDKKRCRAQVKKRWKRNKHSAEHSNPWSQNNCGGGASLHLVPLPTGRGIVIGIGVGGKKSQTCSRRCLFSSYFQVVFCQRRKWKKLIENDLKSEAVAGTSVRQPLDFNGVFCFSFERVEGLAITTKTLHPSPSKGLFIRQDESDQLVAWPSSELSPSVLGPETQLFLIKSRPGDLHLRLGHHNGILLG